MLTCGATILAGILKPASGTVCKDSRRSPSAQETLSPPTLPESGFWLFLLECRS